MPKGDKYIDLTRYLFQVNEEYIILTFREIEKTIGASLPESAYKHAAFWHNGSLSSLSYGWRNAGYLAKVDLKKQKVVFTKGTYMPKRIQTYRHPIHHKRKSPVSCLEIHAAISAIRAFHETTVDGIHTRYLSWFHCYNAFQQHWQDNSKTEYLCLHLAWYLASWGMLRNSFLLNHDYFIHKKAVQALCSKEFESLFADPFSPQIDLTIKAADLIKRSYPVAHLSDTFITKILLGIFACTPAYDRFFVSSARNYAICRGQFSHHSLGSLWGYYSNYKTEFATLQTEFLRDGIIYPPMKLMDMCLWQLGYSDQKQK